MRKLMNILGLVFFSALLSVSLCAQQLPGPTSSQVLSKGGSLTFNNPYPNAVNEQVEFLWGTGTGGSAVMINIQGCNGGSQCVTVDNISSTAAVDNIYTLTTNIYSSFIVSGTWTGGNASITVKLAAAQYNPANAIKWSSILFPSFVNSAVIPNGEIVQIGDAAGTMALTLQQNFASLYSVFSTQWGLNTQSSASVSDCLGNATPTQHLTFIGAGASDTNPSSLAFCVDNSGSDLGAYVVADNGAIRNAAGAVIKNPAAGTSSIGSTFLDSGSTSHFSVYAVSGYADTTIVGTSCTTNTTVALNVISQDPNAAGTTTTVLGTYTITNNGTLGNFTAFAPLTFVAKTGTSLSYSTTYTAGANCAPAPTVQVYLTSTRLK